MGKHKPKGACEGCDNSPRVLTQIESGQWVCQACLREIRGPQRPKHLAKPEQVARLREHGLDVPDDLERAEHDRLSAMVTLRQRGVLIDPSATLEELQELELRTYVNHRTVNLAGASHDNRDGTSRQEIIARCSAGELLRVLHEDGNPVDPNAIAVVRLNGEQLGYLPRDDASAVMEGIRDGWMYAAVITKILDIGTREHILGVGLSLVYARSTADKPTVMKHIDDLMRKYREAT